MVRRNSTLRTILDTSGVEFIEQCSQAIERILPHVRVTRWSEGKWAKPGSVWTSSARTAIRMTLAIGDASKSTSRSLKAEIERRPLPRSVTSPNKTLDLREFNICRLIASRIDEVSQKELPHWSSASMRAIRDAFDEYVVANHVESYHKLKVSVGSVFEALHTLSEQTYENKALTFGCILDDGPDSKTVDAEFPGVYLAAKKYKALSDGFRTAYHVSGSGALLGFVDLDRFEKKSPTARHYYPEWSEPIARGTRAGRCGIALSRQGDILVFDGGTLRFTYRYGRWQYWNHSHLVNLLRDRARAQRVPTNILGQVVGAIYRAALDVSFRRSGGLFVILHNRNSLRDIVRPGDAIGDSQRGATDTQFDAVVSEHKFQALPRAIAAELASLDGAVVLENAGTIRAYGAVLQPKKTGRLRGTEGSRTKAAIGASNYGLSVKVSSDGDITVYYKGAEFIRI
jgi:hypothetical protein